MDWSEWKKFGETKIKELRDICGIYKIRCLRGTKPLIIQRTNGKDIEGIIYVGETTKLKSRLRGFYNDIQKDKSRALRYTASDFSHIAGERYVQLDYNKIFNRFNLEFSWCPIDKEKLKDFEWRELKKYHEKFFDLPPLNFSLSSRWRE